MGTFLLSSLQYKGLLKLGDVVIPGDNDLPKFSDTEQAQYADKMLKYMNKDDLDGLKLVLIIFALLPKFFIAFILNISEKAQGEGFIASQLRLVNIGLKGVSLTLYYSNLNENGQQIHNILKWDSEIKSVPKGVDEMEQYTDSYANNKVQNLVINADHSEADIAEKVYARARQNQAEVTRMSIEERLKFITRLKEVIIERREWIIEKIQKDNGKTKTDALVSEIFGVLDHLHWLEKNTKKALKDETVATPIALMGKKSKIYYDALGTILVISPWNYPFYQAIVPITAAFVAGNTVVYKPSEFTPLEGVLEELMELSGIKSEWVQIVYGTGKMGAALIDQRPDKIFFTGSVATGKKIMRQASEQLIPVELELGGKDPAIVFEDANIERAARGVVWGALTCTGQSCTSVEQVYVHDSIYDKFKSVVLSEVKKIRLGETTDGEGELGLMTTEGQVHIVADHLEDAKNKGASVLSGSEWDGKSRAIPPLVFENLNDEMKLTHEETFGPILPLMKFTIEQDLIDKLNKSEYGLSSSVWSGDKARCERVAHALHTGNVSINNVMLTEGNPNLPFGGVKNSGIGRYKGVHGLRGFTNMKSIIFDANSSKCEVNWYPYTAKKYRSFDKMMVALFSGGIMNFIKFALTGVGLESYSDKIAKK